MPELFTELRFSILRDKIAKLQIPDAVYNWFVDFFDGHEHCTTFGGTRSSMQSITASIIQGSAIGPAMLSMQRIYTQSPTAT